MAAALGAIPAIAADPGHIDAYVTPYYDSSGPTIRVGKYSGGLASEDRREFVGTIQRMKQQWNALDFVEVYVAAIRLYDLGYRNEATYWFYSAQYRGRLFALLVDQNKMGGIGAPGFELYHAQNAFFQLVGPSINGFAFGNIDRLVPVIRKGAVGESDGAERYCNLSGRGLRRHVAVERQECRTQCGARYARRIAAA